MDVEHLQGALRCAATTPSRRSVSRALLSLGAGSVLAPLLTPWSGEAKKKKKKKKKKINWEQYCKEEYGQREGVWCPFLPDPPPAPCCYGSTPICTERGCCPRGFTKICTTDTNYINTDPFLSNPDCCEDGSHCCYGAFGEVSCCGPDQECCSDVCCGPGKFCCGGKGCCIEGVQGCCPDGRCSLYC